LSRGKFCFGCGALGNCCPSDLTPKHKMPLRAQERAMLTSEAMPLSDSLRGKTPVQPAVAPALDQIAPLPLD
jgi:hypothetical protein